ARAFMSPAPRRLLDGLVERGQLTSEEARLARRVPVAEDVTVEADSGGHTDNRPLGALLPVLVRLRDGIVRDHDYPRPLRVGAAGGLGTPAALAAAFAMGADYVLTGSVNQASVEAALSRRAKELLLDANLADVTMAPSPDMFEMGVKVQVLRRGTLFAQRAQRLYDVYIAHRDLTALPVAVRAEVESILGDPLDVAWARTAAFWRERDPGELERAERDARHRMALTFRSYVGLASRWAIDGNEARLHDFQIWCGPAQGAFNDWVRGTPLEPLEARGVVTIAHHLLEGAAACTRAAQLRSLGVAVPASCFTPTPR
ncbi:MAG: 2-nitropropane dioxygenase, partial [Myxococcota bacterium]